LFPSDATERSNKCAKCPRETTQSFAFNATVSIKPVQELKFGALYQCKKCKSDWYLDQDEKRMSRVMQDQLSCILDWNKQPTSLTDAQKEVLTEIGSTPTSFTFVPAPADYPCRVVTTSGQDIKLAVIRRHKHAPMQSLDNIRYAHEIAEILESPFALPLQIRIATTQSREVRNGLNLTFVESKGDTFALRWTNHFFVKHGHKAKHVTLTEHGDGFEALPRVQDIEEEIVYFLAD
jgi:hypothetical protein